jgi:excisionase family DNA binding protein
MPTTYTTQEAADKLQVSERTLRNWIIEGYVKAEKLNPYSKSVYRIPKEEIVRILTKRKGGKTRKK